MFLHEESKGVRALYLGHGMVLFFPSMDNGAQRIEQRIKWMLLIRAHFINQAVEALQGQIVFLLVLNLE
jgi:hypothetical protein